MFPLHDDIPSRTTPYINYLMIGLCTAAFLLQLAMSSRDVSLVERYGMIPARVMHPQAQIMVPEQVVVRTQFGLEEAIRTRPAQQADFSPLITLLTCVFLHGGWMHFLGNMWFLHIFGDNVEDRLGHSGYLLFYLGAGLAASITHLVTNVGSTVPTIGASGAIAGVMGAYMFMYPRAMVLSLVPLYMFVQTIALPAPLFLGIWFAMQFFNGMATVTSAPSSGVAWWAHIGGFVAGAAVAKLLDATHHLRPPVLERREGRRRYDEYPSRTSGLFRE